MDTTFHFSEYNVSDILHVPKEKIKDNFEKYNYEFKLEKDYTILNNNIIYSKEGIILHSKIIIIKSSWKLENKIKEVNDIVEKKFKENINNLLILKILTIEIERSIGHLNTIHEIISGLDHYNDI
ncbi:MAG: hypothetical protein IPH62_19950 [Ignavibacteriae bacterium]|nr:hypothetical protein [Ignavibacteriota bacterium]